MPKERIEADIENRLGEMAIRSEDIGHRADELVHCEACGRTNAPDRPACIYCGSGLDKGATVVEGLSLNLRRLENWENGHNVVCRTPPGANVSAAIARLFGIGPEIGKGLLASGSIVPAARMESERDAKAAVDHLVRLGADMTVIGDVRLKMGKPNIRLRALEFSKEMIKATEFNTGEQRAFQEGEVALIVVGSLFESRTDLITKRKKNTENILDQSTVTSDDMVVDLYNAEDERGWRISTRGFDFSGLGEAKASTARENIERLIDKLQMFFPEARFSNDYKKIVGPLSEVWPLDERVDHEGLKRIGIWKSGFARSTRLGNLDQFQRFSRLQRIAG
ncbi:MAG TPA: hypothetical protein PKD26_08995 [Pyrinomonadaceae bacterium]|nr:hypothetical protein [Pyrinomonadaceae bacterium]